MFEQLQQPQRASDIAAACQIQPRAAQALLDGLVACELALCRGDQYRNGEEADFYLVPGKLQYLGDFVLLGARSAHAWLQLAHVARGGQPVLSSDDGAWSDTVNAITPLTLAAARTAADTLAVAGAFELLDLGGGSGAFSAVWLSLSKQGRATHIDRPAVNQQAHAYTQRFGHGDRLQIVDGDILEAELDTYRYDYVALSQVLHFFPPAACQHLLSRCRRTLRPGGVLVIADFVVEPNATGTPWALAFSSNMLLATTQGAALRREQLATWLSRAGFDEVAGEPVPGMPHTLIYAR